MVRRMQVFKVLSNLSACAYSVGDFAKALQSAESRYLHCQHSLVYISSYKAFINTLGETYAYTGRRAFIHPDLHSIFTYSIRLNPNWSKSHGRKGAALAG